MNDRQLTARLISLVLTGRLTVRQALQSFPMNTTDKSILTAYHALIHYEADEDLRSRDAMYKDEQDEYLQLLAEILSQNRTLPQNIINSYKEYDSTVALPKDKKVRYLIAKLIKFLNIK